MAESMATEQKLCCDVLMQEDLFFMAEAACKAEFMIMRRLYRLVSADVVNGTPEGDNVHTSLSVNLVCAEVAVKSGVMMTYRLSKQPYIFKT